MGRAIVNFEVPLKTLKSGKKIINPTSKSLIAELDKLLCEKEDYKGKKNLKKPQVSRADIREIRKLICKEMAKSSLLISAMIESGK
jgi:hypothetical protein